MSGKVEAGFPSDIAPKKIPMASIDIRIQTEDFDIAAEVERLRSADTGAIVTFSGVCRDEDGRLSALELEHYPGMAEAEIKRIAEEATGRWPVTAITVIHRHGKISPRENIVLVVTTSSHRQAAFEAANFLMDFLKTRAPFWKKEHERSGRTGEWVAAVDDDDRAAARWGQE
jgi:molybdopterin synthase catalytic subunit